MSSKQETKRRIKSVDATKKITNAMQLVAASKLYSFKTKMNESHDYGYLLYETVGQILMTNQDFDSPYLTKREASNDLYIIVNSSLGLCGGYNSNLLKYAKTFVKADDEVILLGSKGASFASLNEWNVIEMHAQIVNHPNYDEIIQISKGLVSKYLKQEIRSIKMVYTEYVNPMTFEPKQIDLLPIDMSLFEKPRNHQELLFEPSAAVVLDRLIPMYLHSLIYSLLSESVTSEQASRRFAMENATKNAEDLKEELLLQYNRARQAAITQEISEIVGGSNAQ